MHNFTVVVSYLFVAISGGSYKYNLECCGKAESAGVKNAAIENAGLENVGIKNMASVEGLNERT